MAQFNGLHYTENYDVIHPETGDYMTQGIQGGDLMRFADWPDGAEAYECGAMEYDEEDPDGENTPTPAAVAE